MTNRLPSTLVSPQPVVRQDAERVWHMKSKGCAERDHYDIQPQVSFFDDSGTLIASVVCNQGRDGALAVIRLGCGPLQPAVVVTHMDAHITQSPINPATGKSWGPGEMQAACDGEGACATGLLTDCIATTAVFRDGHAEMINRMYHGHEKAGDLHWVEPDHLVDADGDQRVGGYVTDVMRQAMTDNTFADMAREMAKSMDVTPEVAYWSGVSMALKCMIGVRAVLAAIPNPPTQELQDYVKQSLSQESVEQFISSPVGTLFEVLAGKWGLE